MNSDPDYGFVDLDRDLPTTSEDVAALRAAREAVRACHLEKMNLLDARRVFPSLPRRRTRFPEMPEFEL